MYFKIKIKIKLIKAIGNNKYCMLSKNYYKELKMKCPHCQTNVELDSKLYFKSFLGKYTCPSCLKEFKLKRGMKYFGWVLIAIFIAFLDSYFVMKFAETTTFSSVIFIFWLVILFFSYCYIDRKLENNMPTVKID